MFDGGAAVIYPITPVPAPRQVRSDSFGKPRPSVARYRAFRDECRLRRVEFRNGDSVIFHLPMPYSWTAKKQREMLFRPHTQRPDIDNLLKALLDALYSDDSHISDIGSVRKRWALSGSIEIYREA